MSDNKILSLWWDNSLNNSKNNLSFNDNKLLLYWANKLWLEITAWKKLVWWNEFYDDEFFEWYICQSWTVRILDYEGDSHKYPKKWLIYMNFIDNNWNYLLNDWEVWFIKEFKEDRTVVKLVLWNGLSSWNLLKWELLLRNRLNKEWYIQIDNETYAFYWKKDEYQYDDIRRTFMFNKWYECVEWPFLWKYYKVCRKKRNKIIDLEDVLRRIDPRVWGEWNVCDLNWNLLFDEWFWEIQICSNWCMIVWTDYDEFTEGWYNIVDKNWNFLLDRWTYNVKYVWDWFFKIENHDFIMEHKDLFLKNNKVSNFVNIAKYNKHMCEVFDDGSDYSDIIFFLIDEKWNVNYSTLYYDIWKFSEWYAMVEFPWLWKNFIDHNWNLLF